MLLFFSMSEKKFPDTDMRGVDYDGAKTYSVKRGVLCDKCGNCNVCYLAVQECDKFKPTIGFVPPLGQLTGSFNTIRLGAAWKKRGVQGTVVTLVNTKSKEIIGDAIITGIYVDEKDTIALKHGKNNHLLKPKKLGADEAAKEIKRILVNCYGKLYYNHAKKLTAIRLRVDSS